MILDVFTSVFNADATELKKGYREAQRSTDDIVNSMKSAEKQADNTTKSISDLALKAASFLGAAVVASKTFSLAIDEADDVQRLSDLSFAINSSIEDVDAFGKAIKELGGTKEAAESDLVGLFVSVKEAVTDSASASAVQFKKLGIATKDANGKMRETSEVMLDLASAVDGMDADKARKYIETIGITDKRTIEAISKGRAHLESLIKTQKEAGVISKESAEKALAFNSAMNKLQNGLGGIKNDIATAIMPVFTKLLNWLSNIAKWAREHSDFVVGSLAAIAAILTVAFAPALWAAAAGLWALISPFALVAAAIVGLGLLFGLVYEDIKAFKDGNDSLIGALIEKYPALGKVIDTVFDGIQAAVKTVGSIVDWLKDKWVDGTDAMEKAVRKFVNWLSTTTKTVQGWGSDFSGAFSNVVNKIVGMFAWMWEKVKEVIGWIGDGIDSISSGFGKVKDFFGFGDDDVVVEANKQLNIASSNPANAVSTEQLKASYKSSDYNLSIGEIKIETQATDASGIAGDMQSELDKQIQSIIEEGNRGAQ